MTPAPPSSSNDSSLPPRSRPNKGTLSQDTTESDLWAFDELDDIDSVRPAAVTRVPEPRIKEPTKPAAEILPEPAPRSTNPERIQMDVSKSRARAQSTRSLPESSKAGSDFEDLDHWDEAAPAPAPAAEKLSSEELPPAAEFSTLPDDEVAETKPDETAEIAPAVVVPPAAAPLRIALNLSKPERLGLVVLGVLLLLGAVFFVAFSLNRLPTEPLIAATNDYPIKGRNLTVAAAESYWRAPIVEGSRPDVFRRGTALLPVLDISTRDGSAALRVVFRNEAGELVGDTVTHSVRSGQKLEIPATAGFDEVGMHAAYRTGESKPWTIEVYEAPSVDSPSAEFKWLFKMTISTVLR